jgi:4-hydroxybenzoyl-CoA thioesterase
MHWILAASSPRCSNNGVEVLPFRSNRIEFEVEWGDCDPAEIVWNPRFFELFDRGTWTLFQSVLGVPRQNLAKHFGIASIPLVEAGAQFMVPLKFGDAAELVSRPTYFRRASFAVSHQIFKGGKLAVDGLETRVWAGVHPDDPARMRATTIPSEVIEQFRATA